ncbi:MAG: hypothetical protein ACUBOA_00600 [Candidatus Loosdrechtia sp.]|nr:MAG: hypothetical protein QY305_13650 [Candidatus Jettenia sp. AMX2]
MRFYYGIVIASDSEAISAFGIASEKTLAMTGGIVFSSIEDMLGLMLRVI